METDNVNVGKESKLSELTNRIDITNGNLVRSIERLDTTSDRLMGPAPEGENPVKEASESGSIGALENIVNGLERQTNRLLSSIDRLCNSGVI